MSLYKIIIIIIISGEAVMFGEHVDENNLESIIFPRAAAVVSLNTNNTTYLTPPLFNYNNIYHTPCLYQCILLRGKDFGVHPLLQVWKILYIYIHTYTHIL